MTWTIRDCEECDDGMIYHYACAGLCDHDRSCAKCRGTGKVPKRVSGFEAAAIILAFPEDCYPTRAVTWEAIQS